MLLASLCASLLALAVLLYLCWPSVRSYCKPLLPVFVISVAAFITFPLIFVRPKDVRNIRSLCSVTQFLLKPTSISWEVKGLHNLKENTPAIIIANHQSTLDLLGSSQIWHLIHPCTCVVKNSIKYYGPFGLFLYFSGIIFIDRSRTTEAKDILNAQVKYWTHEKSAKLWFYPEGTRNLNGSILPFKKGAFHVAIQTQVPIIPIVFSSQIPYYQETEGTKSISSNTNPFVLTVLDPIPTKGLTTDHLDKLSESFRQSMLKTFLETSQT